MLDQSRLICYNYRVYGASVYLVFCLCEYGIVVVSPSRKRFEYRAVVLCAFVFWFCGFGQTGKIFASCGDYLHHNAAKSPIKQLVQSNSDESSSQSCKCKNGECKSAPQPMPAEPFRVAVPRQQQNHELVCVALNELNQTGSIFNWDDLVPFAPSLELPDPPPRAV